MPFSQLDWPLPYTRIRRSLDALTWIQSPAVPAQMPGASGDWPNPTTRKRTSLDALTWTQSPAVPTVVVTLPFAPSDMALPVRLRRPVDTLSWVQSPAVPPPPLTGLPFGPTTDVPVRRVNSRTHLSFDYGVSRLPLLGISTDDTFIMALW